MYLCRFCSAEQDESELEMDAQHKGYWCVYCDGYTYLNNTDNVHRFILVMEEKKTQTHRPPPLKHKFRSQLSLLRYPGSKGKVIASLSELIVQKHTKRLVSPYTGGGSVELALLAAGMVKELHLNDYDFGVYSLFYLIKNNPHPLIHWIANFTPTHDKFFEARKIIKDKYKDQDLFGAALSLLVVNRLAFSGIYKANPLGGRNGDQNSLLSRWNPLNLIERIKFIHQMSKNITITNDDACEVIEEAYWENRTTLYIDPPYVKAGKDLYLHYYDKRDHIRLNVLLESLYHGMPGADIVLTYDDDPLITELYQYPEIFKLARRYSI
ncbi:hypothetical protein CA598_06425 [Paenibacillus sp. VTT E-133291]|nr:hypothetical protein CA598_06425 [Paenibacillus sp. VTT E-133291]